jgi:putative membrane protein
MRARTRRVLKSAAAGAAGGLVASYVMNIFQSALGEAGQVFPRGRDQEKSGSREQSDDATVKAAAAISRAVFHHELSRSAKKVAGPAIHYAFGTALGAVYGLWAESRPYSRPRLGLAYGALVWLGADELAVPALKLAPSPLKTPLASHVQALASHLVFGLATDALRRTAIRRVR